LKVCKQVVIVEYSDSLNCLINYSNSKEDSKNRIARTGSPATAGTLATTGILATRGTTATARMPVRVGQEIC
jgi:hypothetical protein